MGNCRRTTGTLLTASFVSKKSMPLTTVSFRFYRYLLSFSSFGPPSCIGKKSFFANTPQSRVRTRTSSIRK
jgi:hypothetical protein